MMRYYMNIIRISLNSWQRMIHVDRVSQPVIAVRYLFFKKSFVAIFLFSVIFFFFSSRRRHTRFDCDWSSDVCSSDLRDMVLVTLRAMALGGMRDHIGGGFHRYSVDAGWRVPHFEKMLYDQAQLVLAYTEAAQLTRDPFFADVAIDTLEYVRRDLTHPEGGFYSAEDADSVPANEAHEESPHKREGAFYVWHDREIADALGDDAALFRLRYGVLPDGNAPFDPQNEFTYQNLLYTARTVEDIAAATGAPVDAIDAALARARARLLEVRSTRPRPHLDDKVLTAWNGLM